MRILTAEDVRAALPMIDAIDAMRTAFVALSTGKATVPLRSALPTPDGVTLLMPAYIASEPISVVKLASVYPGNPARGLPTIHAAVLVFNAETGETLALIDGGALTAIRTGAGSGLATDLLARQDAMTLGVIGAGVQARTQIEAVCAVRPIVQIRIYSPKRAQALADELRGRSSAVVTAVGSASEALRGADVVIAATNSQGPVFDDADLAAGVHVNGIGSFTPQMREVPQATVARAKIVGDHRESLWAEAGELIAARDAGLIADIHAELGEVVAGLKVGRESADEVTFFKSVGNAVQDAAAAARVLQQAAAYGLGRVVEF